MASVYKNNFKFFEFELSNEFLKIAGLDNNIPRSLMILNEFRESLKDRDLKGLDSEFTYSTRRLVALFNAEGAHLNRWWVMTSVEWFCPCCKRTKGQIVR